jgi:hypothetical protein
MRTCLLVGFCLAGPARGEIFRFPQGDILGLQEVSLKSDNNGKGYQI